MELSFSIARWKGKRILFVVVPEEEKIIREKPGLRSKAFHRLPFRVWSEGGAHRRRLERWIAKVDRWIITDQPVAEEWMSEIVCSVYASGKPVTDFDTFLLEVDRTVPANPSRLVRLLLSSGGGHDLGWRIYSRLKSAIEPALALFLMVIFSPLFLLAAMLVKFADGGPIIYSQERVGHRGKVFRIFKFRSMRVNAENGVAAWAVASKKDPNLTSVGGFLRSSHLDELPQLWNVVRGEMSFIGPRPERPVFVEKLIQANPLFRLRPLVKPGITGWAQTEQGYANSIADSLHKLEFDLFYILKNRPALDLKILFRTIAVLFAGGTEEMKRNQMAQVKAGP